MWKLLYFCTFKGSWSLKHFNSFILVLGELLTFYFTKTDGISYKLSLILYFSSAGYKDVNASVPCDVGSIRNSSLDQGCCKLRLF